MSDATFEWVRMANVILTIAAGGGLFLRANDDWERLTRGWRIALAGLVALLFALCFGSIEALYQDAPLGARAVLVAASCMVVLLGLFLARNDVRIPGARMVEASLVIEAVQLADSGEFGLPCEHPGCVAAREELYKLLARRHPFPHEDGPHPQG